MIVKIVVEKSPEGYDHDSVRFDVDGKIKGFGFIPRKRYGDQTIALQKCPLCEKENYALSIASGQCSWCPFNTNQAEI